MFVSCILDRSSNKEKNHEIIYSFTSVILSCLNPKFCLRIENLGMGNDIQIQELNSDKIPKMQLDFSTLKNQMFVQEFRCIREFQTVERRENFEHKKMFSRDEHYQIVGKCFRETTRRRQQVTLIRRQIEEDDEEPRAYLS